MTITRIFLNVQGSMVLVQYFFCRGYHPGGLLCIWKIFHSLGHGILTRPVKCWHRDKVIMFGCPSWMRFEHRETVNLEVKCFTITCSVLFLIWNLQQPEEQMPHKAISHMRYVGLENQGATCYLNTVLQILFMTEEFREAIEEYVMNNSNSTIINCIAELFECLKSRERNTATTEEITAELNINVYKQEDAAKYLQKILNMVCPEISKVFQGKMVQITSCIDPAKDHKPLEQEKTFFIISISLDSQSHINVQSCFDSYFEPITMHGESQQVYCNYCGMMMDTKMISSLQKVPSVLVLHLERFEGHYDTMCCVKNYSVQISAQLLVKECDVKEGKRTHTYDLYAVANHVGSLTGGHYYADIKSFEDQQWYRFNDSSVYTISDLKSDSDKPLLSDKAYLLLYKKCESESPQNNSTQICNDPEDTAGPDVSLSAECTGDTFSVVNETKRPEKHRKRANTLPNKDQPKPLKKRRCSEPEIYQTNKHSDDHDNDTQSTVQDQQNHQKNINSNSETKGNASQTMEGDSIHGTQSNDGENDNQSKLIASNADQDSEQQGSDVSVGNQKQSNVNNNETRRPLIKYGILSVLVCIILLHLFICITLIYYCPPHLLSFAVVVLLLSLILSIYASEKCIVSYFATMFTTGRNYDLQHSVI